MSTKFEYRRTRQITLGFANSQISEMYRKEWIIGVGYKFAQLPLNIRSIFPYAEKTLDIQKTIGEKMANLPPRQFIDFLRPAFQEDEWKLIAVGAALGGVAGILQSMLI